MIQRIAGSGGSPELRQRRVFSGIVLGHTPRTPDRHRRRWFNARRQRGGRGFDWLRHCLRGRGLRNHSLRSHSRRWKFGRRDGRSRNGLRGDGRGRGSRHRAGRSRNDLSRNDLSRNDLGRNDLGRNVRSGIDPSRNGRVRADRGRIGRGRDGHRWDSFRRDRIHSDCRRRNGRRLQCGRNQTRHNWLERLRIWFCCRRRYTDAAGRRRSFFFRARGCFHFTRERSVHCCCSRIASRTFPYCGSDLAATLRADPVEHAF